MGLIRLMKRFGGGYAAVQPTDQIACDVTLTTITPTGASSSSALADLLGQLDTYRYKKAINANSTLLAAVPSGVLPVDAMISYAQANASNGSASSTVMMAATQLASAQLGGEFETLVLSPWLTSLGYTSSSSPTTNAGLITTLRTAAHALAS